MPIFDYKCDCGSSKKDCFVKKYDEVVICNNCKKPMDKVLSAPNIGGMDGMGRSQPKDIF